MFDDTVGGKCTFRKYLYINGALNFELCKQVKWPGGKRFEDKFVEMLKKYGYSGSYLSENWLKQPVFIQSFAPTSLVYVSNLTDSPKIFLIDDTTTSTPDTNQVCVSSCANTN